jgi:hypothetical protein
MKNEVHHVCVGSLNGNEGCGGGKWRIAARGEVTGRESAKEIEILLTASQDNLKPET